MNDTQNSDGRTVAPGWYDSTGDGPNAQRYWDGHHWTDQVRVIVGKPEPLRAPLHMAQGIPTPPSQPKSARGLLTAIIWITAASTVLVVILATTGSSNETFALAAVVLFGAPIANIVLAAVALSRVR